VETAQEVEIATLSPRLVKAVLRGEKVAIELFESTSRANAMIDVDMSKVKKMSLGKGLER
jgi:N-acetylglucosamine kinase-like BadF-type ATPase